MTLLLDRPASAGLTLSPQTQRPAPELRTAEDFYLKGADREPDRTIQIRVLAGDGSLRRTWLASYMEDHVNFLLKLLPGWDGYRAAPLSVEAAKAGVEVLFAIADDLSLPPQLFPLSDGGLQLEWHVADDDLEIEVDSTGNAHTLATDAGGRIIVDQEVMPGEPDTLHATRAALRRLSARLAGAR
jgi:hypothetical protein